MLLAGLWIHVQLTYLWDMADNARLVMLIFLSVLFGLGLAQLPPVKFLLAGRASGAEATNTETPTSP